MTLVGFVPDLGSTPKVGVFIFRDPRDLRVAALRFDDLGDPKVNGVSKGPSADLRLKNLAFLCFSSAFPLLFFAFPLLFLAFPSLLLRGPVSKMLVLQGPAPRNY